jgi:hypothetical protein
VVVVECWGAGGGAGGDSPTDTGGTGGTGGYIEVTYDGTAGETLDIRVGGGGDAGGDGNGGPGAGGAGDGQGWFAGGDGADGAFDQGGGGGGGSASAVLTTGGTLIGTGEAGGGGGGANDPDSTARGPGGGGGARGGAGGDGFRAGEDATGSGSGGKGGDGSSGDGDAGNDGGTDTGSAAGSIRTATGGGGNTGDGRVTITEPDVVAPPETTVEVGTPTPGVLADGTVAMSPTVTTVVGTTKHPTLAGAVVNIPATALTVATRAATPSGTGGTQIEPSATPVAVPTRPPTLGVNAWLINNEYIGQVTGETRTPRTLSVTTRVQTNVLTNVLRSLKRNAGKVAVRPTDDGGWTAVDRAAGENTVGVTPPIRRQALRTSGQYHVDQYNEELITQDGGDWDVSLDLIETAPRTDGETTSDVADAVGFPVSFPAPFVGVGDDGAGFPWMFGQSFSRRSGSEWLLVTPANTLITSRVDADVVGTGQTGVKRFRLTVRLTFRQARIFESELSRLAGARVREIPDATNVAVDDTGGNAILGVNAPGGTVVSSGEYVVVEAWESTRLSEAYQEVAIVIAKA